MDTEFIKESVDNILNNPYTNDDEAIGEVMETFTLEAIHHSGCDVKVDGLGPKPKVNVYRRK